MKMSAPLVTNASRRVRHRLGVFLVLVFSALGCASTQNTQAVPPTLSPVKPAAAEAAAAVEGCARDNAALQEPWFLSVKNQLQEYSVTPNEAERTLREQFKVQGVKFEFITGGCEHAWYSVRMVGCANRQPEELGALLAALPRNDALEWTIDTLKKPDTTCDSGPNERVVACGDASVKIEIEGSDAIVTYDFPL